VTSKMFTLSSSYPSRLPVARCATPYMQHLSQKYDLTTHLGVYLRNLNKILLVNTIYPEDNIVSGMLLPMHATGLGKIFLAYLQEEQQEEILNHMELKRFTAKTVTEIDDLRKQLADIHFRGFSCDNSEYMEGTSCIAFPIFNDKTEIVAALSISQREEVISAQREQIIIDGLRCSKQCSMEMGWLMYGS